MTPPVSDATPAWSPAIDTGRRDQRIWLPEMAREITSVWHMLTNDRDCQDLGPDHWGTKPAKPNIGDAVSSQNCIFEGDTTRAEPARPRPPRPI